MELGYEVADETVVCLTRVAGSVTFSSAVCKLFQEGPVGDVEALFQEGKEVGLLLQLFPLLPDVLQAALLAEVAHQEGQLPLAILDLLLEGLHLLLHVVELEVRGGDGSLALPDVRADEPEVPAVVVVGGGDSLQGPQVLVIVDEHGSWNNESIRKGALDYLLQFKLSS